MLLRSKNKANFDYSRVNKSVQNLRLSPSQICD